MRLSDEVCRQARALIASRLGLDFPAGREADLERRFLSACHTSSYSAPETYLAWLATLPAESQEWRRLAGHLTVGETYFFRDRASFAALEQHVLPALIAARRAQGLLQLRIWSAGCATGEEPYSLAILLDRLLPDRSAWSLTILATDINHAALAVARRGLYRQWSLRDTPTWVQERYFSDHGAAGFEVDPRMRQMVTFTLLNLADAGHLATTTDTSAMDVILCRNVLMYFTREAQRAAVERLQRALASGGWLLVSAIEASADLMRPLVPVNFPGAILYRKEPTADAPVRPSCRVATVWPAAVGLWPGADTSRDSVAAQSPLTSPPEAQTNTAPDTTTALQRARALADQGDLGQAHDLCAAVLARDRLDPEAHLLLAAISQERGDIPAALEALRRTVYLAPHCASAHFLLGSLLLRQGEHRRGRRCMETAIRLLSALPREATVPGSGGLLAGRLLETVRASLEPR